MRNKHLLVKTLTRFLYAGGVVFLVSGLLLSAVSSPVLAADAVSSRDSTNIFASFFAKQDPNTEDQSGLMQEKDPGSSLVFSDSCDCFCEYVRANVCNVGAEAMQGSVPWQLYYSPGGNPQLGSVIESGSIGPLDSDECVTLNHTPGISGYFMYRVSQEEGYQGPSDLWSSSCMVSGVCFPATGTPTATVGPTFTPTEPTGEETVTPTFTATVGPPPGVTPTFTATATKGPPPGATPTFTATATVGPPPGVTPTFTATATVGPPPGVTPTFTATAPFIEETISPTATFSPMPYNLSAVCAYATDDYLTWRVANNTNVAIDFTWRVSGGEEAGSGSVGANSATYFFTSPGDKTVHLFVNGERVDSEANVPPCKLELQLNSICAANGQNLEWYIYNPNPFQVNFTWELVGVSSGQGALGGESSLLVTTSPTGSYTLNVSWTDNRPGEHRVSLTSTIEQCEVPVNTATPTPPLTLTSTATQPAATATFTPTNTPTQPAATATTTPTNTPTQPPATVTFTPTNTPTQPGPPPGATASFTPTNTATQPAATATFTPTNTPTQPAATMTFTPTNTVTQPAATATNTPTNTPTQPGPPPAATASNTPTATATNTPTNTVTATNTPTVTATVTNTPPGPPPAVTASPTATVTATFTFTPTATLTSTAPFVVEPTFTPTVTLTATATQIVTLAPPAATSTPPIIPVTGSNMLMPAMATSALGKLFSNIGLFMLGIALALTGLTRGKQE